MASTSTNTITYDQNTRHYFINGMKITGVAVRLEKANNTFDFCIENRVAMTKNEQKILGSKQPYMLPFETKSVSGNKICKRDILQKMIAKINEGSPEKANKTLRGCMYPYSEEHTVIIDTGNEELNLDDDTANNLWTAAVVRQVLYKDRHFPMAVLREAYESEKHTSLEDCLKSLLREEYHKKIKSHVPIPKHKFTYDRKGDGKKCMLVYFIKDEILF